MSEENSKSDRPDDPTKDQPKDPNPQVFAAPAKPQFPPPEDGHRAPDGERKKSKGWYKPARFCMEGIGLVVLIGYTTFAALQWYSMKESNRINREALQSVQRAFITFKTISAVGELPQEVGGEKIWSVEAVWENLGTTPARNVGQGFHILRLPSEPDSKVFLGQDKDARTLMSPAIIGPKTTFNVGPIRLSQPNVLPNMPRIRKGTFEVRSDRYTFFWGWIAYRDVFPTTKLHVSEFCTYLIGGSAESLSEDAPIEFKYQMCKGHNCTDEDCGEYEEIVGMFPK